MSLHDKYKNVLDLGATMDVRDGYVEEKDGRLRFGGQVAHQYDADRLWDLIKTHSGWEAELDVGITVANADIYGVYTVKPGDTLSKIAKQLLGDGRRYMEIFKLNTDVLKSPDMIKVGQKLKLPNRS